MPRLLVAPPVSSSCTLLPCNRQVVEHDYACVLSALSPDCCIGGNCMNRTLMPLLVMYIAADLMMRSTQLQYYLMCLTVFIKLPSCCLLTHMCCAARRHLKSLQAVCSLPLHSLPFSCMPVLLPLLPSLQAWQALSRVTHGLATSCSVSLLWQTYKMATSVSQA